MGLLAGLGLGVLFAPKKGSKLREDIQKERGKGGHGLNSVKDGFVSMGKDIAETAKDAYESEEVQKSISKAKEACGDCCEEGKMQVGKMAKKAEKKARKTVAKAKKKAKKTVKKVTKKAKAFTKKKIGK